MSVPRSRFDKRRRFAAWLAAVAFSLHIIVPLGQAVPVAHAGGQAAYLVICTALGIQQIPNPDAPAPSEERPSCPICQAHALGGVMLAAASLDLAPQPLSFTTLVHPVTDQFAEGRTRRAPSSRDPPIV